MKDLVNLVKSAVGLRLAFAGALLVALLALLPLAGGTAGAVAIPVPVPVQLDMHSIPSIEPGINLSLREKHAAGLSLIRSDRIVLLLEPFGVPAAESFDASGHSLMDYLAQRGYDVWALDFRGFGGSDRPAAFTQPMMANQPQMRAADAVYDVDAAMDYIAGLRGVSRANLLGWSWGSVVASQYAGQHPEKVERLVVYGGMHAFLLPSMTDPMTDPNTGQMKKLPAYQLATPSMSINHWNMQAMGMVPHTPEAETELSRIFLASDPTSGTRDPASIRRAMGPMVDLYQIWTGHPVFDASLITAPTLIIRGDHDTFSDDPGFMAALTNARTKRYVQIPEATHWALYEDAPSQVLMREIGRFLSCGRPDLRLGLTGSRWATYADFTGRRLSVDFRVGNAGVDDAYNLSVAGASFTPGVTLESLTGISLGDVTGGTGKMFTVKYQVPADVTSFRAGVQATVEDGGGIVYGYPAPAA